MQSFPQPLSAAQETVYLRQYQNGDMHARDILIERNLRLVAHIVKKYIPAASELWKEFLTASGETAFYPAGR